jgi:hypothetical protein
MGREEEKWRSEETRGSNRDEEGVGYPDGMTTRRLRIAQFSSVLGNSSELPTEEWKVSCI